MRLVCPNCEAKYEVPDDAIPETGRDVQCANCGHAWFQMRQKPFAAPEAEHGKDAGPVAEPITGAAASAESPSTPQAETVAVPDVVPAVDAAAVSAGVGTDAPTASAGYAVDDSVLAILREEAERETQARKADSLPLESQPDLGIDAALSPTQRRAAMLRADETIGAKPSARRDLLPDVEEINSTLRPSEQPPEEGMATDMPAAIAAKRGGFRSGFLAVMSLAILGTAIYISAPQIGGLVPELTEPLDAYVSFIDGLRMQLDGLMKSATLAINGETG